MDTTAVLVARAPEGHGFYKLRSLPLLGDAAPKTWVEIIRTGEYLGYSDGGDGDHPGIDLTCLQQLVANFERQVNPTVVDYEHNSLNFFNPSSVGAGWIQNLAVRGESLWGYIEFTEKAAGHIKAGEYKFCSAVIFYDANNRETGEPIGAWLHSVALTNVPFVDGLQPISFSVPLRSKKPAATEPTTRVDMKKKPAPKKHSIDAKTIIDAIGELPKDATKEQLLALVEAVCDKQAAIDGTDVEAPGSDVAPPMTVPEPVPPDAKVEAAVPVDKVECATPPVADDEKIEAATPPAADAVVAAAGDVAPPVDNLNAQEIAPDAAMTIATKICSLLGTDAAGAVAFLEEYGPRLGELKTATAVSAAETPVADAASMSALRVELDTLKEVVVTQRDQLVQFRARDEKARKTAMTSQVDDLVKRALILPAQREKALKLAVDGSKESWEMYKDALENKGPVVPITPTKTPKDSERNVQVPFVASVPGVSQEIYEVYAANMKTLFPLPNQKEDLHKAVVAALVKDYPSPAVPEA